MRLSFLVSLGALALWAQHGDNAGKPAQNPAIGNPAAIEAGRKLFAGGCGGCHGAEGQGGRGPNLRDKVMWHSLDDTALYTTIERGIPGTEMPSAWHMTRREVTQVAAYVRSLAKVDVRAVSGNVAAGKALYAKHGCAGCHTLKQNGVFTGGYMGPDLSSIGMKRSAAHLRESLLNPPASLPEGFVPTRAVTVTGKTIEGVRVHEDTFAVVLRDFAGNNHSYLRKDLKEVTADRSRSPMPSYQDKLNATELDDLVAYLVSLKEPLQ